jgi:DNA topoisomerase-1
LRDRGYVTMDKNRFIPDSKGRIVIAFLENFFRRYVEYDFTANLEETLDEISNGDVAWRVFLRDFWKDFIANVEGVGELRITQVLDALNESLGPLIFPKREDGGDPRGCPSCADGRLSLKTGKFGAFIGCSNYPNCNFTRQLSANDQQNAVEGGEKLLGTGPDGLDVLLRVGRFGPYVQLGRDDKEAETKPKRSSLPKTWKVEDIDLEKALLLLTLPRIVGPHPEDQEPIEAALGRFGPYVKHGKTYANLPSIEDVFEIGLNRAVTLIAEKRANPRMGRGGGAGPKPLRELGAHPTSGEKVDVMSGRYGAYVKHGKTNATLPQGADPAKITLEEALELIAAREKRPAKGKPAKAKKTAPAKAKTPTKKPAAKKPAPKKKPAKKAAAQ